MFLVGILSWWYGNGLFSRIQLVLNRLKASADFFSVGLLLNTLFSPYKQISAGNVDGPIGIRLRAFFDRTLSRIIGAIIRSSVIISGLIIMSIQTIFGIVILLSWLIVPMLPAIGLIMWVIGWVPK
ncbi:hypothetical protein COV88_02620 [Candidatus Saccharibacteria bacterium CG11_big_fil_rev_8_21_14_0_20_41_19]|nr:hypothetical protein [Candidatus Saccharibacteria bacterium]OIP86023.1 MAG: hypothetical protein AUK57_01775 [Candidatus Saccharibacteria bacterium CG2_30_41_52]PIQ70787.1 MAG: hypothetical protein COV88_02620 [Candidatus Saccharibacteria bacterium CG11_big_fil_rev_8_21_14_0_20_41_19]PIZ59695.1 MAG: hypothetical protein COY18_02785 [Candidatus Saccharibacteria bacterium CG_4_10_14_0_2_um_filter_41_11]PJC29613.1 MAG: hypothetical protein CO052_02450 [Candidatus Saccharibacteria bacterium CG_4